MKTEQQVQNGIIYIEINVLPRLIEQFKAQIDAKMYNESLDILFDLSVNIAAIEAANRILENSL